MPFTPQALSNLSFGVDPKPLIEIPDALYNGMIHPFTPFPLKGFLWYQGEANAPNPGEYAKLLGSMIESWRRAWGDEAMPFLLAQLPNYIPRPDQGAGRWADLREAQQQVAQEPHNAMTVLLDLGDPHDIHPKDKADVGFRLTQVALRTAYNRTDTVLCPLFDEAKGENGKIRVHFEQAGQGLQAKGGDLRGFEVAGEDGSFQPAQARVEKDSVLVWSEKVARPLSIRYAWGDDPIFNLYGRNGLPAGPFRAKVVPSVSAPQK